MNFFIKDDAMKVQANLRYLVLNGFAACAATTAKLNAIPSSVTDARLCLRPGHSLVWLIVIQAVALANVGNAQVLSPKGKRKAEVPTEWEVVYLGDTRIGYGHQSRETIKEGNRSYFRIRQHLEMRFKRFGDLQIIKMDSQFEDWSDGTIKSFDVSFGDAPSRQTRIVGTSDTRVLRIETTIAKRVTRSSVSLTNDMRSPAYENVAMSQLIKAPGDTVRFKMFKPEMGRTVETAITAQRQTQTRLLDGNWVRVLEAQVTQPQLPDIKIYIDSDGDVVRTDSELFGKQLTTYKVDEKTAMK